MASLTECLVKAGDLLAPDFRDAILARAAELRDSGMTAAGASRQAVADVLAESKGKRTEVESAASEGRELYTDADQRATDAEPGTRLERMAAERPDMRVILPGSDRPMSITEALEVARAEAADDASFADLVKVAAECALNFS